MKIYQAIYTSAVKTLDGRQGLGLVFCSTGLPEKIKETLSRFGYDREAAGAPIYSFERFDTGSGWWLLLNRTVPAVDYTGRTSCVSHTLAIQEEGLKLCYQLQGPFPNVFEFMRQFPWKDSWQGDPRFESAEETLTIEHAFHSIKPPPWDYMRAHNPAALLAFAAEESAIPKPRRVAWRLSGKPPEEILDFFAEAWLCLDPWRGASPYRDLLNEPHIDPLASWICSFTTNLRNNRPDPYQWAVLSPSVPSLPGREILDPVSWQKENSEEIKRRLIESGIPSVITGRIEEGPRAWAQRNLGEKLREIGRSYDDEIHSRNREVAQGLIDLTEAVNAEIEECGPIVDQIQSEFSKSCNDRQSAFDTRKRQFEDAIARAIEENSELLEAYHRKAAPIKALLRQNLADERDNLSEDPPFAKESAQFIERCNLWYRTVPFADIHEVYRRCYELWVEKSNNQEIQLQEKESELESKTVLIEKLQRELVTLRINVENASRREAELNEQSEQPSGPAPSPIDDDPEPSLAALDSSSDQSKAPPVPPALFSDRPKGRLASKRSEVWIFIGTLGFLAVLAGILTWWWISRPTSDSGPPQPKLQVAPDRNSVDPSDPRASNGPNPVAATPEPIAISRESAKLKLNYSNNPEKLSSDSAPQQAAPQQAAPQQAAPQQAAPQQARPSNVDKGDSGQKKSSK